MQVLLVGDVPPAADLDLARVGLGTAPKAPLQTGRAGPSEPG